MVRVVRVVWVVWVVRVVAVWCVGVVRVVAVRVMSVRVMSVREVAVWVVAVYLWAYHLPCVWIFCRSNAVREVVGVGVSGETVPHQLKVDGAGARRGVADITASLDHGR